MTILLIYIILKTEKPGKLRILMNLGSEKQLSFLIIGMIYLLGKKP
jgi:hypothetical protein